MTFSHPEHPNEPYTEPVPGVVFVPEFSSPLPIEIEEIPEPTVEPYIYERTKRHLTKSAVLIFSSSVEGAKIMRARAEHSRGVTDTKKRNDTANMRQKSDVARAVLR